MYCFAPESASHRRRSARPPVVSDAGAAGDAVVPAEPARTAGRVIAERVPDRYREGVSASRRSVEREARPVRRTPYAEWRETAGEPVFSEWLRTGAEPDWTDVAGHPFAASIGRGDVPPEKMRRYLSQDFQFVDSFTALLGAAVACADSFEARVPFGRFLGQIATDTERTYFHRALAALGLDAGPVRPEPVTADFRALMEEVVRGQDYPSIVAVLCVAEWSYLGWASRVPLPLPDDFVHREWVELHRGPDFESWVSFLRRELDRLGPALGEAAQFDLLGTFRRATRLELRFFDMAAA
jgi:thiaminase (transcriptional activator TenA)